MVNRAVACGVIRLRYDDVLELKVVHEKCCLAREIDDHYISKCIPFHERDSEAYCDCRPHILWWIEGRRPTGMTNILTDSSDFL